MGISYKDSGVDIDAGNRFVKAIAPLVKSTFSDRVITGIGGFGALFSGAFPEMSDPVLVSGTDGVGTKIQVARMMQKYDTIGIDAVAMCVNDIAVSGARPLFFLDYLSCGKISESVMVDIIRGVVEGCRQAGASLIGGETAEHPGVMEDGDFDIAGFAVGVVDRKAIIDGSGIGPGDAIVGLASSGVHSNGFSLVRKLLFGVKKYSVESNIPELGASLGEVLLAPTRIYCRPLVACFEAGVPVKGLVHITGGGFYENIPRILPDDAAAVIRKKDLAIPPIFTFMQKEGDIGEREMFTTFNMGTGMMAVLPAGDAGRAVDILREQGEDARVIGEIVKRKDAPVTIA